MKLSCQEGMVPGETLAEKLENLARYGYEGVEFGGGGLAERKKEVLKATKGSGVQVSTICSGYRGVPLSVRKEERDLAVEDIKMLLDLSVELGAVGLIFVPIFGPPQVPDLSPYKTSLELERELLLVLLDELSRVAEQAGSVLLLEPLNRYETHFIRTLAQAVEYAKTIGSPGLKIMADFFHMAIEERDIAASIREAGDWIYHVHLADSTRLLPGYGHTDFKAGFDALKSFGYDKYMAMECGIPGDPTEELPKSAEYLRPFI